MGTRITSIGYALPSVQVTNERWQAEFATKHELMSNEFTRFISEDIEHRYYMEAGARVCDIAAKAAIDCLRRVDFPPEKVQHILHIANVGDSFVNGDGGRVQHLIGATNASATDLTGLACSGFLIALNTATALVEAGRYENVLISCVANPATRAADHRDVASSSLGDLAAATLIEKTDDDCGVLGFCHETRGSHYDFHLHKKVPEGKRTWEADADQPWGKHFLHIDPREGARASRNAAEEFIPNAGKKAMERAGVQSNDLRWFVSHQPGSAPMKIWDKFLGIEKERHPDTLAEIGNSSTCTVPFTLRRMLDAGRIDRGDVLLLLAPGSGYQVGAIVWKW